MGGYATRRRGLIRLLVGATLLALVGVAPAPLRVAAAPMTYTVTNTSPSGPGSLAAAVTASNANDPGAGQNTITFAPGVTGTITIAATLTLSKSVAIDGTGRGITISGGCTGCGLNSSPFQPMGGVRVVQVNSGVTANITALTITRGHASSGGGIANLGGTVTLVNVTVRDNDADVGGGGIENGGTMTLTSSTVLTNLALDGGGIRNGGMLTLTNSTVINNDAYDSQSNNARGGGIENASGGTATLTNVTVSYNSLLGSGGSGGGVYNPAGSTTTARNTIIAGNFNGDLSGPLAGGSTNNVTNGDPNLGYSGLIGLTPTVTPLPGSRAINAGNAAFCPATDQRGVPRPQGGQCDIGATEFVGAVTVDSTGDGVVNFLHCVDATPNNCTLRDAIAATDQGGTITFSAAVFPPMGPAQTITLDPAQGQLALSKNNVTITGPGAKLLTVRRDSMAATRFRIFSVDNVTASITGLTITGGNISDSGGGGIRNSGTLTLTDVAVVGNTATGSSSYASFGGGIATCCHDTLTLVNSTVSGNTATGNPYSSGGGIAAFGDPLVGSSCCPTVILINSTVSGNTAGGNGGGIEVFFADLRATNSTISGNIAGANGGGIYGPGVTLTNVTVSGNTAPNGNGGGIYGDTVTARNTIIAGNTGGDTLGTITNDMNSSLIGVPVPLAPLGDYGGPTKTQPPLPGSPAINMGNAAICAEMGAGKVNNLDQRGISRTMYGVCDIGAVESRGFTLTATGGTPQSVNTGAMFAPLTVSVREGDAAGPLLPGATVTFAATPAANGASAALSGTTAVTNMMGVASVTATANMTGGSYSVTASASGTASTAAFALTNVAPNAPPTLDQPANLTINEDAGQQSVALTGITAGAGDTVQTLTVTATANNTALIPTPVVTYTNPNAMGSLAFTPAPNANGTATITVTVMDTGGTANGGMNTVSRTFTVVVNPVNDAPTLDPPATPITGTAGVAQTVMLTGITAGPANESGQILSVTATSSNTGVVPNPTVTYTGPNTTGSLAFTPASAGMTTIAVTVMDNGGTANGGVNTTTRTFTVNVGAATVTSVAITRVSGGTVTGGVPNIPAGGTMQLTLAATYTDTTMQPVPSGAVWMSSDPNKATVDATGRVMTLAPGTVTITASYMGQTTTFMLVVTALGTGGLMPNPAPVARPDAAPLPPAPPQAAPATRATSGNGGGIGPQGSDTATPTPRPAPPQR